MADARRFYAILTGRNAGYLIIQSVDGSFVTQVYALDGASRPHSDALHDRLDDAMQAAKTGYAGDLHGWHPIPDSELDPLAYAMRHRQRST